MASTDINVESFNNFLSIFKTINTKDDIMNFGLKQITTQIKYRIMNNI